MIPVKLTLKRGCEGIPLGYKTIILFDSQQWHTTCEKKNVVFTNFWAICDDELTLIAESDLLDCTQDYKAQFLGMLAATPSSRKIYDGALV